MKRKLGDWHPAPCCLLSWPTYSFINFLALFLCWQLFWGIALHFYSKLFWAIKNKTKSSNNYKYTLIHLYIHLQNLKKLFLPAECSEPSVSLAEAARLTAPPRAPPHPRQIEQRILVTPSNFKAFVNRIPVWLSISSLRDALSSHLFLPKVGFSTPFPLGYKIKQSHQSLDLLRSWQSAQHH